MAVVGQDSPAVLCVSVQGPVGQVLPAARADLVVDEIAVLATSAVATVALGMIKTAQRMFLLETFALVRDVALAFAFLVPVLVRTLLLRYIALAIFAAHGLASDLATIVLAGVVLVVAIVGHIAVVAAVARGTVVRDPCAPAVAFPVSLVEQQ